MWQLLTLPPRWGATLGIVLAISRAFIGDDCPAFEPELALLEVTAHTHYLPRHWRGRAHTREVQQQFAALFQFKVRGRMSAWLVLSVAVRQTSLSVTWCWIWSGCRLAGEAGGGGSCDVL